MGKKYNKNNANHFYNQIFDTAKFKPEKKLKGGKFGKAPRRVYYSDGSDLLANVKKQFVSFLHVPSANSVFFKAFITSFNETYTSNWKSETVFGRTDPIHSFVQTGRTINLSIMVPAASESEAFENLGRVQKLIQFLYPNYTNVQQAQTISQGPLVRLKIMNLLQNVDNVSATNNADFNSKPEVFYKSYKSLGTDPNFGQLGFINSLTVNHNLENRDAGVFEKIDVMDVQQTIAETSFLDSPQGRGTPVVNTILPKNIEIVVSFTPIHEHPLGWGPNDRFGAVGGTANERHSGEVFPYGIVTSNPVKDEALSHDSYANAEEREDQARLSQQQKENAEARYGGMFGQARARRDLAKGATAAKRAVKAGLAGNTRRANRQAAKSKYYTDNAIGGINTGVVDGEDL
jgi:hypothetical protein